MRTAIVLALLICTGLAITGRCAVPDAVQAPADWPTKGSRTRFPTEVLFQAFTWDAAVNGQKYIWYRTLETSVSELAAAGVTHVWFPPPSRSVAPQGYMPGDYYDLGHGDALGANRTLYGTQAELKHCIARFKAKNIVCVADLVLNHRCGSHKEGEFWNIYHFPSEKAVWEKWAIVKDDYGGTGKPDSGEDFPPAPDLDHSEPRVRKDIIAWMKWLKSDVGFDGWRFDFTKGYGAEYVKEYVEATSPAFSVGEYWTSMNYNQQEMEPSQDPHRTRLKEWIVGAANTCTAFDFTTKGLLQEALGKRQYWRLKDQAGKAAGLVGWMPEASVTFVDNHDTGSTQHHWPFPGEKVAAGYAYILTHPGLPTVFYDHYFRWGAPLKDRLNELIKLRHDLGINRASTLEILKADGDRYAAKVDDKLVLSLGGPGWEPGEGWKLKYFGESYAIWLKST